MQTSVTEQRSQYLQISLSVDTADYQLVPDTSNSAADPTVSDKILISLAPIPWVQVTSNSHSGE